MPAANLRITLTSRADFKSLAHNFSRMQVEKKKACQGDDCHGNPEIDRLRKEVQETKEINKKLRELLQVHTSAHTFSKGIRRFSL